MAGSLAGNAAAGADSVGRDGCSGHPGLPRPGEGDAPGMGLPCPDRLG